MQPDRRCWALDDKLSNCLGMIHLFSCFFFNFWGHDLLAVCSVRSWKVRWSDSFQVSASHTAHGDVCFGLARLVKADSSSKPETQFKLRCDITPLSCHFN